MQRRRGMSLPLLFSTGSGRGLVVAALNALVFKLSIVFGATFEELQRASS